MAPGQVSDQCQIVLGANLANLGPHPFGRTLWKRGVQYATKHMRISCWGPVWGRFRSTFILLAKSQGRSQYVVHFRDDACSEADPASASKHERPVRGDAPDGTAVAGGFRSLVLIWLSACMFWLRFTKTTAGVSRYLPLGHSECGFPAIVSLCRPKGLANLVGMLNMSHITRRYHGYPHRTGQCSQWSGVHVCLRKRAFDISQQSTISVNSCAIGPSE